jgi:hypothetical protein
MKFAVSMTISLLVALLMSSPVFAYVYFVEAEDFDPDKSEPAVGGAIWRVVEDKKAFGGKYMQYSGPHKQASTSLIYPLPPVDKSSFQWKVWVRCIMPDGGSDSYFFYISNDGGKTWGPQQAAHGGGQWQNWQWKGWVLNTPLKKGADNVLKISERENAKADVICVRDDGKTPIDEEYEAWKKEHKTQKIAVNPLHRLITFWADIKRR